VRGSVRPAPAVLLVTLVVVGASLGLLSGSFSAPSSAQSVPTSLPVGLGPAVPVASSDAAGPFAAGPTSPGLPTPAPPLGESVSERGTGSLADSLATAGVPLRYAFLPDLDARSADAIRDGHIEPTYATAPAPMGLADLGLENDSGSIVATTLVSPRIAGTFAPTAFSGIAPDTGAPDAYGVQVNAVLTNVTLFGNSSYQFWTQNVVEYSTFSHQLAFLDNVWNFSGAAGTLSANAINAHGANGTQVGTTFYYALGPVVTMSYPFTLSLFLNSGTTPEGDIVFFNYTLANATETLAGSFDYVEFNSTGGTDTGTVPTPMYLADGASYNPLGIPDDFEIDVVGPGGGSNFDAFNASAALNLYYWSGANQSFSVVPDAYDAGAETGETSAGLSSTWTSSGDLGLRGTPGPAAHLGQGPSLLGPEWGVAPGTEGIAVLHYALSPANGFTFVGAGADPTLSAYGWAPAASSYDLPPSTYSVWSLASEFSPSHSSVLLTTAGASDAVVLAPTPALGVYTPLWASDPAGLANISSSCTAGTCTLLNSQVGPLGTTTATAPAHSYPWFGEFNDFLFPVFPGVFVSNLANVVVASPPSFEVTTPSWLVNETTHFGTPATNDLGLFFYDDENVTLASAPAIGGWWFEPAYFGPSAPQYSVVFWNTSESSVVGNTFTTGGGGLYLYGGENNTVWNNTFLEYLPLAPNEGSLSGAVHGTIGVFDADFGEGRRAGSGCTCADLLYNNAFGDYHTALAPTLDPYTGLAPRLPFESEWNVTPRASPNLLGGPELGGNYWWDYGTSNDPYWVLPYNASGAIAWGGDTDPLVPNPLYLVTFTVQGLPADRPWHLGVYTSTGIAFDTANGSSLVEPWPTGEYFFTATSIDGGYGIASTGIFQVESANQTVPLTFYPLFTLTFLTTNFPNGAFWAITLSNPLFGGFIDLGNVADFPAQTLASGTYNFTISPPAGYTVFPPQGSVNLSQNSTVQLAFSEEGAPGMLSVTLSPAAGAEVWVDGQPVANASSGAFTLSLPAGLHSVRATESGYYSYFNNISIEGGGVTDLAIGFVPLPGAPCSCGTTAVAADLPWVLAAAFGVAAVGLAAALGVVYAGRRPPPAPPPGGLGPFPKN
jgi:thermopsin